MPWKLLHMNFPNILVLLLQRLPINEFTVKDPFYFNEEFIGQKIDFFMGGMDLVSLFTNI